MQLLSKIIFSLTLLFALPVWAFPDKTVKFVISLPVGSGPDSQLRRLAEVLSEKWKQPVVIENRTGGSGIVAMNHLINEPANGYTIGMFTMADIVAFPVLYPANKTQDQMELLAPFFDADMVLFTSPKIKNLTELKQTLKANPTYGSGAVGSIQHIVATEVANMYVSNAVHVPYRDFTNWKIDTSNGTLAFGFTSLGSGNPMYQAGKIHYLAIAAEHRDKKFPNVPTVQELTGQNIVASSWLAFFVKKDLPHLVKQQLVRDIRSVISEQKIQTSLMDVYYIPLNHVTPEKFSQQVERDRMNYKNNLKRYNINLSP
jgi:tripartite-type tricarboxylate transporter receptor subunit TctC